MQGIAGIEDYHILDAVLWDDSKQVVNEIPVWIEHRAPITLLYVARNKQL
jgi:hypothetical protein